MASLFVGLQTFVVVLKRLKTSHLVVFIALLFALLFHLEEYLSEGEEQVGCQKGTSWRGVKKALADTTYGTP